MSQIPVIYSGVANEGGSLAPYPIHNVSAGPWQPAANAITESLSLCTGANTTILRNQYGLTTYRYQYAGNWTNQDPLPWMGAFHSSDLSVRLTFSQSTRLSLTAFCDRCSLACEMLAKCAVDSSCRRTRKSSLGIQELKLKLNAG